MFGTKKELKEQRILADGKLMQSNFNKNYFTKIDIRVDKEIKLYTKSAKILTVHPADSYKLSQDASNPICIAHYQSRIVLEYKQISCSSCKIRT